jgi:hypothetical protein
MLHVIPFIWLRLSARFVFVYEYGMVPFCPAQQAKGHCCGFAKAASGMLVRGGETHRLGRRFGAKDHFTHKYAKRTGFRFYPNSSSSNSRKVKMESVCWTGVSQGSLPAPVLFLPSRCSGTGTRGRRKTDARRVGRKKWTDKTDTKMKSKKTAEET